MLTVARLSGSYQESFHQRQLRLLNAVSRLFMLKDREVAEALGLTKAQYKAQIIHGDGETPITAWIRFCETTGVPVDAIQHGGIARFEALQYQRKAILEDDDSRYFAKIFRNRLLRLFWGRIHAGIKDGRSFQHLNVSGDDLSNCCLTGADFTLSDAVQTNFNCSNLSGSSMSWINLEGASLRGASLRGARMPWAILNGADLTHAILENCDLYGASFDQSTKLPFSMKEANDRGMTFISQEIWENRKAYHQTTTEPYAPVEFKTSSKGGLKSLCRQIEAHRGLDLLIRGFGPSV